MNHVYVKTCQHGRIEGTICMKCDELESLPWDQLADVPLEANVWFRKLGSSQRGARLDRFCMWKNPWEMRFLIAGDWFGFSDLMREMEWSLTPLDEASWKPCSKRWTRESVQ